MKKKILPILMLSFLCSCQSVAESGLISSAEKVKVIFEDDDKFSLSQQTYLVDKGSDLTVFIDFEDGYTYDSINYDDISYDLTEEGDMTLTLHDICFPTSLVLTEKKTGITIIYHANGGTFLADDLENEECFKAHDALVYHLRPNSSIGTDVLKRTGYVQVGWNTKEDGSGLHVGLGSRFTPVTMKTDLYAEWVKYTSLGDFRFEVRDGKAVILSFSGSLKGDTLCIPAYVADYPVTEIGDDVFWNIDYDRVILPPTIQKLGKRSFSDFRIGQLTFFDNLDCVSDESFNDQSIDVADIQAYLKPSFLSGNDNAQFSEKIDRLMLAQGKKKMAFFAGCSMSYGLKSDMVQSQFQDYEIFNLGVIGGTLASFQFQIINQFMEEGDIFIHAPEEMSQYQLLHKLNVEMRSFILVESDYDLLHSASFSENTGFFDAFKEYHDLKANIVTQDYQSDYNPDYDSYGDIIIERPGGDDSAYFQTETCFEISCLDSITSTNLNAEYRILRDKGVTVYFSYAPINYNAVMQEENGMYNARRYDDFMNGNINEAQVISDVSDYIMEARYFFDKDYHLSDEGAKIRTERLISDIREYLPD